MMDPNNVLIRCPNGHELQAAKTDLERPLACPVCNVTFTPGGGPAPAVAGAGGPGAPEVGGTVVDYASDMVSSPVAYPGYTNWMLGLWVGSYIIGAVVELLVLSVLPDRDPGAPLGGATILVGSMSCASWAAWIVAIVLQLMWIYRIHKDARRARGYASVSPVLALGPSFIPLFNFFWTPWTMKKLAGFACRQDAEEDSAEGRTIKATSHCLWAGIVLALSYCLTIGIVGRIWLTVMGEVARQDIAREEIQKVLTEKIAQGTPFAWQVLSPLISVACVLVYFRAVRSLEAALYPFLGAPNR